MQNQKFKIGDKVRRCHDFGGAYGYCGNVTVVVSGVSESAYCPETIYYMNEAGTKKISGFACNYELVEEKQKFDMKKEAWGIFFSSHEEREAIMDWLKIKDFPECSYKASFPSKGSFSNLNYYGTGNLYGFGSGGREQTHWWEGKANEIKLTFETKVVDVEYPETLTEKQKEIKAIREEQEALAARLKKLEEGE